MAHIFYKLSQISLTFMKWHFLTCPRILGKKPSREWAKGNTFITCSSSPLAKVSGSQKAQIEAVAMQPRALRSPSMIWLVCLFLSCCRCFCYRLTPAPFSEGLLTIRWLRSPYLEVPGNHTFFPHLGANGPGLTEEALQSPCFLVPS